MALRYYQFKTYHFSMNTIRYMGSDSIFVFNFTDFRFFYVPFKDIRSVLSKEQRAFLIRTHGTYFLYNKKLFCVCVLANFDSLGLSYSSFRIPCEFSNNYILRAEGFSSNMGAALSLLILDFVLEDVSFRPQNRRFLSLQNLKDKRCVSIYGLYLFSRFVLTNQLTSYRLVLRRHSLMSLYCLNRLYSHSTCYYSLALVARFKTKDEKLIFYMDQYDYFTLITCEYTFYEYFLSYLTSCGFSYIRFAYFLDLFSSLYLLGFMLFQRIVFLDTFRILCVFRSFVRSLIWSEKFCTYFSNFDFSNVALIDFCVSFFVSLYSQPLFNDLFININFRTGATREGCTAAFYDVCLQFFNTCVYSSDALWISFYKTFLDNSVVCRFFKYFTLYNYYYNASCIDSINRKYGSR